MTLRLHDYLPSGNGYKVRLLLTQLGIPFERIEYDIDRGETRTPAFLENVNANGRVPVLETEEGEFLPESNAILFYLSSGTPLLPDDRLGRARALQWMYFEQYSIFSQNTWIRLLRLTDRGSFQRAIDVLVILALVVAALAAAAAFAVDSTTSFKMVRSQAAVDNDYLEGAKANVDVRTTPTDNQIMDVTVNHAPKNTEFELFVTQQPNKLFGISWYQADFTTNNQGSGEVRARGIFSEELFAVAPGVVNAPQVDDLDAEKNPAFAPVHTFHVGLWFGSPEEAQAAGCTANVTPFDGDHEAGIQAFSTRNFPALHGPLRQIQ